MRPLSASALLLSFAAIVYAQAPAIYNAFVKGGPILIGTITQVQPPENGAAGSVTVAVDTQLRGEAVGPEFKMRYMPAPRSSKFPPSAWSRIMPETGKNVLVFLTGGPGQWQAAEVLDLDHGDDKWIPEIRASLNLEADASRREKGPLFEALNSSETMIRSLASELLLNRICGTTDTDCRMQVLDRLASIARDSRRPLTDRTWAAGRIAHGVVLGFSPNDSVDSAAVTALARLLTESDPGLRGAVVQDLHALLVGGGTLKPSLDLSTAEREKIARQLSADSQQKLPFAREARGLADFFARQ